MVSCGSGGDLASTHQARQQTHLRRGRRLQAQLLQLLGRGRLGRALLRLRLARRTLCRLQLHLPGSQLRLQAAHVGVVLRLNQRRPQLQVGTRLFSRRRTLVRCVSCPPAMQAVCGCM